jgi:hypothetical protein
MVMISISWGLLYSFSSLCYLILSKFIFFPTIDIKIVSNLRDSSSMYYD